MTNSGPGEKIVSDELTNVQDESDLELEKRGFCQHNGTGF
jgi:hypothetical protein